MAPTPKRRRTERVQIYLDPTVEQEKLLLDVWKTCVRIDKPQDVFRAILRAGVRSMLESGELPESVVTATKLTTRMRIAAPAPVMHQPQYYQPFYQDRGLPQPAPSGDIPAAAPAPAPVPAPAAEPVALKPAPAPDRQPSPAGAPPNTDDILGLMGRKTARAG